jgi:hypothetical protein
MFAERMRESMRPADGGVDDAVFERRGRERGIV